MGLQEELRKPLIYAGELLRYLLGYDNIKVSTFHVLIEILAHILRILLLSLKKSDDEE